jgi:hypothetical protein
MNYLQRIEHKRLRQNTSASHVESTHVTAANETKRDGNHVGMSGDADLTPSKRPHVSISVVVKKEDPVITVYSFSPMPYYWCEHPNLNSEFVNYL